MKTTEKSAAKKEYYNKFVKMKQNFKIMLTIKE